MKKRLKSTLLVMFALALAAVYIIGCSAKTPAEADFKDISVTDAFDLIQINQGNSDFVILDVRTPDEFNAGHINDAVNINYESADFSSQVSKLDKNKTYLVYCRSGNRSRSASAVLVSLGFKNVYNMLSGINQWEAEGFPVIK